MSLFSVNRGNGDSIKHAYQLLTALLKDADADLMNLLSSNTESQKAKSRSTTVTSTNENNISEEIAKIQRANSTNYGSRLQNNGKQKLIFVCSDEFIK